MPSDREPEEESNNEVFHDVAESLEGMVSTEKLYSRVSKCY